MYFRILKYYRNCETEAVRDFQLFFIWPASSDNGRSGAMVLLNLLEEIISTSQTSIIAAEPHSKPS